MHWRKKKGEPTALYERLIEEQDESMEGACKKDFVSVLRVLGKLTSSREQGRGMQWRRKGEASVPYERLVEKQDESMKGPCKEDFVSVLSKLTSSREQGRSMQQRRKGEPAVPYERLVEEQDASVKGPCKKDFVSVLAVSDDGHVERFLVHVTLFKHPCIKALVEVAEHQFGHQQKGVLRLPCSAECFRYVIGLFSKH